MTFEALYLSLKCLSKVIHPRSIDLAEGATAITLVPRLERGITVGSIERDTLSWLEEASLPTLSDLITAGKLTDRALFTHDGTFYGTGFGNDATHSDEQKTARVVPTLHAKFPSIDPRVVLKVRVRPENYTKADARSELSGEHKLFMVGRLTISTLPVLKAEAYAIGHLHEHPRFYLLTSDQKALAPIELSERQKADYEEFVYQCRDKVYIPGKIPINKRNVLVVNGKEVSVEDSPFTLLLRFVVELKRGKGGWVDTQTLKSEKVISDALNYQIYNRLRTALKGALLDKDALKFIQSDGSKHYRISTHPDFITYDKQKLLNHLITAIKKLAEDLP